MGVQGDLMSNERWGRECMLQLQEDENWNKPTATTWAAEFLLRGGESREILGSWIRSGKVPEAKKRRVKQVITCSINQPFIVLTETKFSYRYISVWARYSPHRTRVEAHANMLSP
jgi:hypothetical protein